MGAFLALSPQTLTSRTGNHVGFRRTERRIRRHGTGANYGQPEAMGKGQVEGAAATSENIQWNEGGTTDPLPHSIYSTWYLALC